MKHLIPFFEYSTFDSDKPTVALSDTLEEIRQKLGWGLKDFNDIKSVLNSECSDFIREIKGTRKGTDGTLIYRGLRGEIKYDIPGLVDKKVRKGRKPADMDAKISNALDQVIYQEMGVNLRKEGIFTSKSYRSARNYAQVVNISMKDQRPFVIFPKGDYSYYWSEKNRDLFGSVNGEGNWYEYVSHDDAQFVIDRIASQRQADKTNMSTEQWAEYCKSIHDELYDEYDKFKTRVSTSYVKGTDLSIIGDHEITFICDEYYAVDAVFLPYITEWLFNK